MLVNVVPRLFQPISSHNGAMTKRPVPERSRKDASPFGRNVRLALSTIGSIVCVVAKTCLTGLRQSGRAYAIEAAGVFDESHDS